MGAAGVASADGGRAAASEPGGSQGGAVAAGSGESRPDPPVASLGPQKMFNAFTPPVPMPTSA
eukprot:4495217-Alexandrium_andersonii.AAC.1